MDHDGRLLSYDEFRHLARKLAGDLRGRGVRPGDRVMLVCENCAAYAVAVMAVSLLDGWIVPVNARASGQELSSLRDHSGARLVLFTTGVCRDAARHARAFGAADIAGADCGGLAAGPVLDAVPEPDRSVAVLLYTTGTTSAPKGVMLTHDNLRWNAGASTRVRHIAPGDLVLAVLPGSHVFGFATTMLAAFLAGACVRFIPRFAPDAVLRALAEGVTVFPAVPQMYQRLLEHLHNSGVALAAPRLHYISAGGAPLDPDLKQRTEAVFGLSLQNGYGITECTATVAVTRPEAPRDDVSAGSAVEDVTVWIDAPDDKGIGELVVQSPGVMAGYYRDPKASAAVLPRAGVFRTGDLGRIGADGGIWIEGRVKELIIRSGFNVYPPEIEAMLTRHEKVLQAAVVGRRVGANEEILAFVMTRGELLGLELSDWLRPRIVAYKRPQHIFIVDALPVAPTGKVLKHKLIPHFASLLAGLKDGAETERKDATS